MLQGWLLMPCEIRGCGSKTLPQKMENTINAKFPMSSRMETRMLMIDNSEWHKSSCKHILCTSSILSSFLNLLKVETLTRVLEYIGVQKIQFWLLLDSRQGLNRVLWRYKIMRAFHYRLFWGGATYTSWRVHGWIWWEHATQVMSSSNDE